MKYSTEGRQSGTAISWWRMGTKATTDRKTLVAAAEANGIKVYKSWPKARIWKALMSV